jgi:hypothetical protein
MPTGGGERKFILAVAVLGAAVGAIGMFIGFSGWITFSQERYAVVFEVLSMPGMFVVLPVIVLMGYAHGGGPNVAFISAMLIVNAGIYGGISWLIIRLKRGLDGWVRE